MNRTIRIGMAGAMLLGGVGAASAGSNVEHGPAVEKALQRVVHRGAVPRDFEVVYDDLDGFHGGTRIEVHGDGTIRRVDVFEGEERTREAKLSDAQLLALAKRLIAVEAWKQQTASRETGVDETRASLQVEVGDVHTGFWEWFNDMPKNARLASVKAELERLIPAQSPAQSPAEEGR